jgi:hypothetical protein
MTPRQIREYADRHRLDYVRLLEVLVTRSSVVTHESLDNARRRLADEDRFAIADEPTEAAAP